MTLTQAQENYFGTLSECADACEVRLDLADAILLNNNSTPAEIIGSGIGPVSYGETRQASYEIFTLKGKPTRKWFNVSIYRMESGNYELTTYIL